MKFQVIHKGRRYWAHRRGRHYSFWSDHWGDFFHGHFSTDDREEAFRAFIDWLPFKLETS